MQRIWNLEKYGKQIAVITDGDKSYTYYDILKKQKELEFFTKERIVIFIIATNTMPSLLGYLSCLINGSIPLFLDEKVPTDRMQTLIKAYSPKYLWIPKGKTHPSLHDFHVTYTLENYELWENSTHNTYEINSELALLLPTSGSTSNPKMVRQSYENIICNTRDICEFLEMKEIDRAPTILPMSYTFGLSIINTHLYVGGTILLTTKSVMQPSFWNYFNQYKGTSISGVPYTFELLRKIKMNQRNLPTLRQITQAGGHLSEKNQRFFGEYARKSGRKFIVMYGQTEATARISYLPSERCLEKIGSVGIVIPHGKLSIVEGEVVYEGKNVMLGYAEGKMDLKRGEEMNHKLITGDRGYFDQEGYLYLTGRKSREVKIYGKRVNLEDIENLLNKEKLLKEAIYLVEGKGKIYLISENTIEPLKVTYIMNKTGLNKSAFAISNIKEIPRKESGKIDYQEL